MGVQKPWAPPRSYGLVLRVAADGRVIGSLHSQVDGKHHGITGIVEHAGRLLVASKGAGRLLAAPLDGATTIVDTAVADAVSSSADSDRGGRS